MTSSTCYRLFWVLWFLTGCACSESDGGAVASTPPSWEDAVDIDIPLATGSAAGDDCRPVDIGLAEWLAYGDALVFGRVTDVGWTEVPAAVFGHAQSRHHTVTFEDDCAGDVIPAFAVTLDGLQVLHDHETGILSDTSQLTLLFSPVPYRSWIPMPRPADDGSVAWSSEGGLAPGQWVGGILLHHAKSGHWGLQSRFHLMQVRSDGAVWAPDMSQHPLSCLRLEPWIDGAHIDDLQAAIDGIDWSAPDTAENIARIQEEIGDPANRTGTLFWFHSARCGESEPAEPLPEFECFGYGDCEPGQQCVDYLCVDE
jgi:hypothetical protein